MNRRIGAFYIARKLIAEDPGAAIAILSGCIVLRAEMHCIEDRIEYKAFRPSFDELNDWEPVPLYEVRCTLDEGQYLVEFRRVPGVS